MDRKIDELMKGRGFESGSSFFERFRKGVFLYGAGGIGKETAAILIRKGIKIQAFIDRDAKPGDEWENMHVIPPESHQISMHGGVCKSVIITIFNHYSDVAEVVDSLSQLGFTDIVSFPCLYQFLSLQFKERYWLCHHGFYADKGDVIEKGRGIWADESSRDLYDRIIRFRLTGDYCILPAPQGYLEYFCDDVPFAGKPRRYVDCGAYDGDSIKALLRYSSGVEALVAFEPDPSSFACLTKNVHDLRGSLPESTVLFPCGVWSGGRQAGFAVRPGGGSEIVSDQEEGNAVFVVSLDEVLPNWNPDFIKMDIEGSELNALQGGRRLITESRPDLAIAVYHRPQDLWEIPLLIDSWKLGYRLYLRSRAFSTFDTLLYALQG